MYFVSKGNLFDFLIKLFVIYKSVRYILPSFKSRPFVLGEVQNRFSVWRLSCILDRKDFGDFFIYKSPRYFLPSGESVGFSVKENKLKIYFQDGGLGGHLGFSLLERF